MIDVRNPGDGFAALRARIHALGPSARAAPPQPLGSVPPDGKVTMHRRSMSASSLPISIERLVRTTRRTAISCTKPTRER